MPDALKKADEVLQQTVQGITDIINCASLINCDFADVQTVMTDAGIAHIGIGESRGDNKALEAVQQAVESPLLETSIQGAEKVIINIRGDISLMDANDAASYVQDITGDDANIIFGAMYDDSVADACTITVIATGLTDTNARPKKEEKPAPKAAAPEEKPMPKLVKPTYNQYKAQAPQIDFQQTPVKSNVEKQDIQIPDFLKRK
jgi:cell division protein FtsZ